MASSLEAEPTVTLDAAELKALENLDLAEICITAPAVVREEEDLFTLLKKHDKTVALLMANEEMSAVTVNNAPGCKCARCWKVLPEVKEDTSLCTRCTDAVAAQKKSEAA